MSRFVHTYEQAIEFLFGRINYERVTGIAFSSDDQKLVRMRRLLEQIGNPHEGLKVIHVAGTKGKGSTSAMAAAILTASGYKTGLYTSPHVSAFEERMVVDGKPPSARQFVDLVNRLIEPIEHMDGATEGPGPTYFELATALAWLYFRDCGADLAVLEVGLGGRLDATNVCDPHISVITNISRDHTNILGNSPAEIAGEKAGIVKAGIPVISGVGPGPAADVVEAVCRRHQSALYRLGGEIFWRPCRDDESKRARSIELTSASTHSRNLTQGRAIDVQTPWGEWSGLKVPLRGDHQADNAALAVAAATFLRKVGVPLPDSAVEAGLSGMRWPARIEVLGTRPTVVVDAAHNWASTHALLRALDQDFSAASRRILVFAATRDKDVAGMLRLLLPRFDSVVLTQYQSNPRGVPIDELAALVQATAIRSCHVAADPALAWSLASHLAACDDLICVTGSFFIASELRELILDCQGGGANKIERPDTDAVCS
ncbi:MAG TPA: folylpolyglutamate synthase/dihydrofolate synthase family protein [Planctomycetaceae bacterium]|jgi:dihydrofolate synthase/folylpolyglutamate synthase|nr:folylpolyglutamate synthase/dihydrofolate synthase family protein [Planctomycetaceae bacterium]